MSMLLLIIASLITLCSASTSHPLVELNFDFVGNDITNLPGSAVDKCTELCESTQGCKAYSWSNYNNGTCWLKSDRTQVIPKYGVISAYLWATSPQICQLLEDIDFVGNDIASVPSPDIEKCCYICSRTFNCRAYTWSNYNSGTCWLKSQRGVAINKSGVKSADAYPNDAPLLLLNFNVDFVGNDILNRPSPSADQCFGICKGISECKAFSWSNYMGGTCWLKSGSDKQIDNLGVVSGRMP